jgi:serine/threonine protein phosphatase 1
VWVFWVDFRRFRMTARIWAIGDIHGCDVALERLLERIAPTADDTVVVLGDIVDRGPNSRRAVELLMRLRSQCQLVHLIGNHEQVMLEALDGGSVALLRSWLSIGGLETLESYGGQSIGLVPPHHVRFLRAGLNYWETEHAIFIHANLLPGVELADQPDYALRWEHLTGWEPPWHDGREIICGHTSQKDGVPKTLEGWVCIDTYAHGGGWLTALDVTTDTIHQARQSGEARGPLPLADVARPLRS